VSSLNRVHLGETRSAKKISVMESLLSRLRIWAAHMTDGLFFFLNRVPDFSHGYMTKDQVSDQTSLSYFETTHFTLN